MDNVRIGETMGSKKEKQKKTNDKANKNYKMGYIKLFFLFASTIGLCILFRNWYLNGMNYELSTPIIGETLIQEVNGSEIYTYIRENENAVIYIGVPSDKDCRNFEMDFNKIIVDQQLENSITYLNLTKEKKVKTFIKEFNKFYDTNLLWYPSIVIFEDGKVKDLLTTKDDKVITKEQVLEFLKNNKEHLEY